MNVPESCAGHREVSGEALTGVSTGQPLSRERILIPVADAFYSAEGNSRWCAIARTHALGVVVEPGMSIRASYGNREVSSLAVRDVCCGPHWEGEEPKPMMHGPEKSDLGVVAMKSANKLGTSAESMERRLGAKGNARERSTCRTQRRESVQRSLHRVRQRARQERKERFTSLLHHVTHELLDAAFSTLKKNAAAGIDGVVWRDYEADRTANLRSLHDRLHRGTYRPKASRRQYIPKADGRLRPLGIAALEDKIVQSALVSVLSAVYEEDFVGFSYGFRPGRGQHDALDALAVGMDRAKVNWVVDADIERLRHRLQVDVAGVEIKVFVAAGRLALGRHRDLRYVVRRVWSEVGDFAQARENPQRITLRQISRLRSGPTALLSWVSMSLLMNCVVRQVLIDLAHTGPQLFTAARAGFLNHRFPATPGSW